jgi:D-inositol-3-phosphate glycosyltransferase
MRVAMISEHASPLAALGGVDAGGLNVHVGALATALARRGHEVEIFTRRDARRQPATVPLDNRTSVVHVPVGPAKYVPKDELLPFMGDFGRWLADRWADDASAPDVVHAHYWTSGLAALTATAASGIPVVLTYHVLGTVKRRHLGDKDTSPDTRLGLERTLGTKVNRIIAQSDDEVEEISRMGIARSDITIVPSGVDVEHFSPGGPAAQTAATEAGRRRVLSVGRLVPRKGFDDLVHALRVLPDVELTVVGGPPADKLDDDPEAKRLRELAERVGVADRVQLVGGRQPGELPPWYRSADVVACTPRYEPFGRTALEAMACGVPVVAYAVGGLAESVIDGVTGVLVPPHDVRALAGALRGVLTDEMRRMSFASAAVDRVRSRYTWDRTAFEVERVYALVTGAELPADGTLTEVPT